MEEEPHPLREVEEEERLAAEKERCCSHGVGWACSWGRFLARWGGGGVRPPL